MSSRSSCAMQYDILICSGCAYKRHGMMYVCGIIYRSYFLPYT